MNRIYQGRVSGVELAIGKKQFQPLSDDPKKARRLGEELLAGHHELFQDAVNYYIVALAALGASPESKLTQLADLLGKVWERAEKKGQMRRGMRNSLRKAWGLAEAPTLEEALATFREPLTQNDVPRTTAERAGEYLLFKLGGEAAIQQGGREFFPMFCDPGFSGTFKLSAARRGRTEDEKRLQREIHRDLSQPEIVALAESITLGSVVNLQPGGEVDTGAAAVERLKAAAKTFSDDLSEAEMGLWLASLRADFALPKRRGGNINVKRVDACTLFLAFANARTKALLQSTFAAPKAAGEQKEKQEDAVDESRFVVDGEDPIKLARGTRGCVFVAYTALPLWAGDGRTPAWKEFDIAAFKEALKVYNQFQQNVEKRAEKLDGIAMRLLVMDGERVIASYADDTFSRIRSRLARLWQECNGKPQPPKNESGEEQAVARFAGDDRIDRLRQIVNDDLAEEYRLTDGRRTAYGLRRRTMKGWSEVKRRWQSVDGANGNFSEEVRMRLKAELDSMRGGEKREQIGSHKLFEALLADEKAWAIWKKDDAMQETILKNGWAADPLEAFREYCELREALEEIDARPLNFTPADAQFSRRLFMFTDACSFGSDRGEYRHELTAQAVIVPVAVRGADGKYATRTCRLSYSAPRLLRDRIRGEDGTYVQDWTQPMMRALFGEQEGKSNPQELKDAAVQLMPDYEDGALARVLLNFPLDLDESRLLARLGKSVLWEKQFVSWKKGAQLPFLRWAEDFDGKEPHRWWMKTEAFTVLAADLGTRHAASVALLECGKAKGGTSRFIGEAGGEKWHARYQSGTILRLPGEDVKVLRPEGPRDSDGLGKAFREELFGSRGRSADLAESVEALAIVAALQQADFFGEELSAAELGKRLSFPEQNDKLIVAMRRAQNWIATCISWHWKLSDPDVPEQRAAALEQLREHDRFPEWKALAGGGDAEVEKLRTVLHAHIAEQRLVVQAQLLALTKRILPLRGREWEWVAHPEKADCHLLRQTAPGTAPEDVKLRGQRGLSMARIEQLSDLRRRWQSLNQSLRREIGQRPLTAAQMRDDAIPDPCPDLLTKLENMREQRVNQTAHLILAQALGLKLKAPSLSPEKRTATDTHGEYEVARPPVDFIVVEDLARYLSDQGRAKSENTRLMKWCHRAITQKLKMLAEPFGIPVLETPAAYSSRFCSLTGAAGFRAVEVGWEDRRGYRWRSLLEVDRAALAKEISEAVNNKARSETLQRRNAEVDAAVALFSELEKISHSERPNRTLLAPQPGGPIFITARRVPHPAPGTKRSHGGKDVLPIQADLNAAINLALRAVANPACADIHHRLRTERKKGAKDVTDTFFARETRRFGKEKVEVFSEKANGLPKEKNPNLFYDAHKVASFGRARLACGDEGEFPYASGPGIWKAANDRKSQWDRCREINEARVSGWTHAEDHIPM